MIRRRPPQIRRLASSYTGTVPRKVLQVDGPWEAEWASLYASRDCDGIQWTWATRAKGADVEPLLALGAVRFVALHLRGVDDALLSALSTVSELTLNSDSRTNLNLSAMKHLTVGAIERPVFPSLNALNQLKSLWVSGWRSPVFVAPSASQLDHLRVEGARGGPWITELLNISAVPKLETIWFDEVIPGSLEPLSALPRLRKLNVHCRRPPREPVLDLTPLARARRLRDLNLSGCCVLSLDPLFELKELRTFAGPAHYQTGDLAGLEEAVLARRKERI